MKINVKVSELSSSSNVELTRICDYCDKILKKQAYATILMRRAKSGGVDRCYPVCDLKPKENHIPTIILNENVSDLENIEIKEKTVKNKFGIIYKITNLINQKVYIGQTTKINGFNGRYQGRGQRLERFINYCIFKQKNNEPYNEHLYRSIVKYGIESFKVEEEFDVAYSKEELDNKEKYWIKYYCSSDKNCGYNNTVGGDGFNIGKSAYIEQMGSKRNPILCVDTKEIFLTLKEAEQKTGIRAKNIRESCLDKTKYAVSVKHNKKYKFKYISYNNYSKPPILCINTNEIFINVKEAGEKYKVDTRSIYNCCNGTSKSAGKHPDTKEKLKWSYALDYKIEQEFDT